MNTKLKYTLIGFGSILIAGFLVLTFTLDSMIETGIEEVGSEMAKTSVTVDGVSVSPFSGSGTIRGFKVDNPEGFETEHAVVIENFSISLDISSLFTDEIVINDIVVAEPNLAVIQKVPENNLRMLLGNLEAGSSSGSSYSMVIEHLLIKDGEVSVTPNIGESPTGLVKMESIEFTDLGKEGESTTDQVVRKIAAKVVNEALKSALSGELEDLKDKAKEAVEGIFSESGNS